MENLRNRAAHRFTSYQLWIGFVSSTLASIAVTRGAVPTERSHSAAPHAYCQDCHGSVSAPVAVRFDRGQSVELCLRCHDGQRGTPDVLADDANRLRDRSGGQFAQPGVWNPDGHDLVGHGIAAGLACIDCHDPHAGEAVRLLLPRTGAAAGAPLGLFVDPAANGLERYERTHVAYGSAASPRLLEPSVLCLGCHSELAESASSNRGPVGRHAMHPSYDSERSAPHHIAEGGPRRTTDAVYWEAGLGAAFDVGRVPFVTTGARDFASASAVDAERNGVFCLSCHKAHGSDNAFGLVWAQGRATQRSGCDQCHAIRPLPEGDGIPSQLVETQK